MNWENTLGLEKQYNHFHTCPGCLVINKVFEEEVYLENLPEHLIIRMNIHQTLLNAYISWHKNDFTFYITDAVPDFQVLETFEQMLNRCTQKLKGLTKSKTQDKTITF